MLWINDLPLYGVDFDGFYWKIIWNWSNGYQMIEWEDEVCLG